MACVDVGCGGGDVAFDLARLVGPSGTVVALDVDKIKIESARREAAAMQLTNVDFRVSDIYDASLEAEFDLAHARFLLSHLRDPERALLKMRQALRPGKMLVIADTDFRGPFLRSGLQGIQALCRALHRNRSSPRWGCMHRPPPAPTAERERIRKSTDERRAARWHGR
jgi:ubiquinone/menaquinone biosynthesis C-methylase UbiE